MRNNAEIELVYVAASVRHTEASTTRDKKRLVPDGKTFGYSIAQKPLENHSAALPLC